MRPEPDNFILAGVDFIDGNAHRVHHVRRRFNRKASFGLTGVRYNLSELPVCAE